MWFRGLYISRVRGAFGAFGAVGVQGLGLGVEVFRF